MTTYLVVQNKPDSAVAYKFDTRDRAEFGGGMIKDHLVRDGACCYVIENEHDVALSGPRLVDLFNALTESGLKKFESRAIGVERLLRILPTVAVDPPEPKEEAVSEVHTEEKTEKKSGRAPVNESHPSKPQWKKYRAGSMRARVIEAMFHGATEPATIARRAGIPEDRVVPHIYATWRDCGIGYEAKDGHYHLMLPPGVSKLEEMHAETPVKVEKPKKVDRAA